METSALLFALLRNAVCNEELNTETVKYCTPEALQAVSSLAHKHNLAHVVAHAVGKMEFPECEVLVKLKKTKMLAIYRYAQLEYELERICRLLEDAQIPFIPLKGAVLRQYYREPWMRTSSDIDVLVRETDLNRAAEYLVSQLGYENKGRAYHDVGFRSPSGILLELHFILTEESFFPMAQRFVDAVWEYTEPVHGRSFERRLTKEMFYFHHILHMARHFCVGGCGIRFILDHFIINANLHGDPEICRELLCESGLSCFAEAVDELSKVWFSGKEHTTLTRKMEEYILSGGTFGSSENYAAARQAKKGSKFQSFFSKIILPYDQLKGLFPILREKKWLTPVFQIVRWFRLLKSERWNRSVVFLRSNINVETEKVEFVGSLMQELGL